MGKERLNPNFNITAKYETMLEQAKSIVDGYLSHADATCEPPTYISLAYDVKNYLPKLHQENKQLKEELELKSGMNIAVQNLKLIDENKQLKDVIEEVREIIDTYKYVENDDGMYEPILDGYDIQKLLQILDKGERDE